MEKRRGSLSALAAGTACVGGGGRLCWRQGCACVGGGGACLGGMICFQAFPINSSEERVVPFCRQKGTEKAPLFRSGMGSAARFTAPPYAPLQRLRRTISVAKMLDNTQSIICAFCLAAGTPRTPYQCVESCGAALIYPASLPLRFRQDKFSKRPHCDAADPRREEVASAEILQ